jgi:hypothetical protein
MYEPTQIYKMYNKILRHAKRIFFLLNQYVDFVYQHRLYIETGRYKNIPRNERLCKNCSANEIEDEAHFLIKSEKFH